MTARRYFTFVYTAKAAIATAALLAIGALAAAETPATAPPEAIAARQSGFKKMGAAMKALGDQLKSDTPATEAMLAAATTIAATASNQGALFPAGSGPAPGLVTAALPNIWTDRGTFDMQMASLVAQSGKLVAVAENGDVEAIRAQVKATGATCGACHHQFRADQ